MIDATAGTWTVSFTYDLDGDGFHDILIGANGELRLAGHGPEQMYRYQNARCRLPGLQEQRFCQIVDAWRLVYCELACPVWVLTS